MSTCATCRYMMAGWCNAGDRRRPLDAQACEVYRPKPMTLAEMISAGALLWDDDDDLDAFLAERGDLD